MPKIINAKTTRQAITIPTIGPAPNFFFFLLELFLLFECDDFECDGFECDGFECDDGFDDVDGFDDDVEALPLPKYSIKLLLFDNIIIIMS